MGGNFLSGRIFIGANFLREIFMIPSISRNTKSTFSIPLSQAFYNITRFYVYKWSVKHTLNLAILHHNVLETFNHFLCYVWISYVIVMIKTLFRGCSTQKMLWKLHKVLSKTTLIESYFNKDVGLQMFWKLFAMLFNFRMYKWFPSV